MAVSGQTSSFAGPEDVGGLLFRFSLRERADLDDDGLDDLLAQSPARRRAAMRSSATIGLGAAAAPLTGSAALARVREIG